MEKLAEARACFWFEILQCARSGTASELIKGLQPTADVVIVYIDRSKKMHRMTTQTIETIDTIGSGITFCVSDNVDIADANVGSALTLAVTR